jgi:ParB-like chromosome segregation protein Spo0J
LSTGRSTGWSNTRAIRAATTRRWTACGAIKEFGFRIPVVARSDGLVVDGHLRLKAARRLGLATVPVVLADELTEAQIKAFRLLANQSANWAEWDEDMLRVELQELESLDFDLDLAGFDAEEIERLLNGGDAEQQAGLTDEDAVPEAQARHPAWRSVAAGSAPAALWRCHEPCQC